MYKSLLAALCAATALSACATMPASLPPPVAISDNTTLDETALLTLEVGYKSWRLAIGLALDAGQLKGEPARRISLVDARLYGTLKIAEGAYQAGNASSYSAALISARSALSEALPLIEGVAH